MGMGSAMDGNLLKAAAEAHHKDISSRLRGSECGFGPCGCICSDFQGHGRLQCLCLGGRPIHSEQVVFDSECCGCKCGSEGVLRVQGCGEGCAAVNRSRSSSELLTLGHGRAVRNYAKLI